MAESPSASQKRERSCQLPPSPAPVSLVDTKSCVIDDEEKPRHQNVPTVFACYRCSETFTSTNCLHSHLLSHQEGQRVDYIACGCGKVPAHQHGCTPHQSLHAGPMDYVCRGRLHDGSSWGCGLAFSDADLLAEHLYSRRACIMPLFEEEAAGKTNPHQQPQASENPSQPVRTEKRLPLRLLAQYPGLAGVDWDALQTGLWINGQSHSSPGISNLTGTYQAPGDSLINVPESNIATWPSNPVSPASMFSGRFSATQEQFGEESLAPYSCAFTPPSHDSAVDLEFDILEAGDALEIVPINAECDGPPVAIPVDTIQHGIHEEYAYYSRSNAMPREASASDPVVQGLHKLEMAVVESDAKRQESCIPSVLTGVQDVDHLSAGHSPSKEKSRESLEVVQTESSDAITTTSCSSPRDVSMYEVARDALHRLRSDIEDLTDGAETASEISRSDSETLSDTNSSFKNEHEQCISPSTDNPEENAEANSEDSHRSQSSSGTAQELAASASSLDHTNRKRQIASDGSDDLTRAELGLTCKKTKLSSKRFICCFHDGPGRKCSGTDETISEVVKKLSEQHDTHVCDRCWTLKTRDESSGVLVHGNEEVQCLDHCLSPQCHKTPTSLGYRHLFNPDTCKRKTSRVRPGDGEAIFRFIFQIVHPTLDPPDRVTTDQYALHLDARPRQGRRKLTREELTMRADQLEKKLEEGDEQNLALNARVLELEHALVASHEATRKEMEKSLGLEKQMRRIVAMLSDALRTGSFPDQFGHKSLLRRVEEDAPDALDFQSQSQSVPPGLTGSQKSGSTPASNDVDAADLAISWRNSLDTAVGIAVPATLAGFSELDTGMTCTWLFEDSSVNQASYNHVGPNLDTININPAGTNVTHKEQHIIDNRASHPSLDPGFSHS